MKLAAVEHVARLLNEAEVPYLVVGGIAVVAHGYGRATQDIDLVIRLEPVAVRKAFEALSKAGFRPRVPVSAEQFGDPEQRGRMIADKGMTVLGFFSDQHRGTGLDVFVTEPFHFQDEYAAAVVQEVAPGVPLRVVRLPTLIRMKRAAGRQQDLADIAELRRLHGDNCES